MENSATHTRRALLLTLGGGTAMSLLSNPAGADGDGDENENTHLEIHENIDAEESDNQDQDQPVDQSYPVPECKVIRPTDHDHGQERRKMPEQ